ncbi:MAG: hypothetical protein ACLSHU_10295 [Oscillospiraceae bacterium]
MTNQLYGQIYPLGLCGAPREHDGNLAHRILRILDWIPHIQSTGADTVLLNPLWESDRHGYDTRRLQRRWLPAWEPGGPPAGRLPGHSTRQALRVMLDRCYNSCGPGLLGLPGCAEKSGTAPTGTAVPPGPMEHPATMAASWYEATGGTTLRGR